MRRNPTLEEVLSDNRPGWRTLSVGWPTCEFRVICNDGHCGPREVPYRPMFRVEQLVVDRHPEDGGGATGSWRTIASATSGSEAVKAMQDEQMAFMQEMQRRRRGQARQTSG